MMPRSRFVVLSEEFPPRPGGVAQFSSDICKVLQQEQRLVRAISIDTEPPLETDVASLHVSLPNRRTGVRLGDHVTVLRKFNSAFYKLQCELEFTWQKRLLRQLQQLRSQNGDFIVWLTYTVHHPEIIPRVLQHANFPYWILFHGLDLIGAKSGGAPVDAWVSGAERVVFNSQATQQLYGELGFRRNGNEAICYPGVNVQAIAAIHEGNEDVIFDRFSELRDTPFLMATVCRLIRRKGVDLAIRGAADYLRNHPKAYFVIAGTGPEEPTLRALAQELQLEKQVLFIGYVSETEKFSLLHHADLFLMPNRSFGGTDFEGFGISFAEASLMGTCVVGGKHGGACEAILDGKTGYLIDTEHDKAAVEEIASRIATISADTSSRLRTARYAREYIKKHFDVHNTVRHLFASERAVATPDGLRSADTPRP